MHIFKYRMNGTLIGLYKKIQYIHVASKTVNLESGIYIFIQVVMLDERSWN